MTVDAIRATGISVAAPGDEDYDARRSTFNAMIDRHPALVGRCTSTDEVAAMILYARRHGLPVSVRGGGHSVAGHCIGEGAVVVDLAGLRKVEVDPRSQTATAGGGTTWLEYDNATQRLGLASTGGTFTDTGIGGLTLGGGIGHLQGKFGFAVDNLKAVRLVTAGGDVVRASEGENADLFWAVRGGGGNFGVVTEFEYKVHPVTELYGGMIAYPVADAATVLRMARDLAASAPDELVLVAAVGTNRQTGAAVAFISACFQGPSAAGERILEPLRRTIPPVMDALRPLSYSEMQATFPLMPFGLRHYWKGSFATDLPDQTIEAAVDHFQHRPVPSFSALLFEFIGGAPTRVPAESMAFNHREARVNLSALGIWEDAARDPEHIGWARDFVTKLGLDGTAAPYVNYMSVDESGDRVRAAYGDAKFARLRDVKKRFDPDNVFRFNQNIPPAD